MIDTVAVVVSIVLSIAAFIISVGNLHLEERKVVAESMINNRVDWIKDVRNLMIEFIENYYSRESNKKLQVCKVKIELYTRRSSPAYEKLNRILETCINSEFNANDYDMLITECQNVLNDMWIRAKIEAGISMRKDKQIYKLFGKKNSQL